MFHGLDYRRGRLFPAWAGVIPVVRSYPTAAPTFPRMGGGDPEMLESGQINAHFSPHGRG